MYYDLLEPYIEIIKHLYNKVIDYFNNIIANTSHSNNIDKISNIENEIKSGIRSGIKEALEDVIDEMENESKIKSDYLIKNFIVASSVLFAVYLFIYLPSDATDINQFNSINQLLINLKLTVIDIFNSKPGTGDAGAGAGIGGNNISPVINTISPPSPISPISPAESSTYSSYFKSPAAVAQAISPISDSIATITPNTPVAVPTEITSSLATANEAGVINNASNISNISPVINTATDAIPTVSQYLEKEVATNIPAHVVKYVETTIDGRSVGKMVEIINILNYVLPDDTAELLKNHANKNITKIWH